jgi:Tfp pilus assembly protein PilE
MGQQQLLLIVLSVIIVGIAVVVGINMFTASAASSNLEAVTNDLLNLAARAQQYYVKPGSMKGATGVTNSFTGLTIADLTAKPTNDNGTYSVTAADQTATITGVGTQDGDGDGTNCTVHVVVTPTGITTTVDNR